MLVLDYVGNLGDEGSNINQTLVWQMERTAFAHARAYAHTRVWSCSL